MTADAASPTIEVDDGTLVRIARMPDSRLRTKNTKRHGTQCLLRRFQVIFPGLDATEAHEGTGYVTADAPTAAATRELASRRVPFHAIVSHRRLRSVHIVRLVRDDEAQAIVRRERRRREDAEWETAAPGAAP